MHTHIYNICIYIYPICLPTERCIGMSNPPSNQFKHSLYRKSIVFLCTSLSSFGAFKKLLPTGIKTHICPKHASPTSFNCTRSCRSNRHHQQQQQLQPQHKSCQSKTVAKNCYRAINKMVCTTFFSFRFFRFVLLLLLLPAMQNYATFLCLIPH